MSYEDQLRVLSVDIIALNQFCLKCCNDDQSLLIREIYAAICHTIAHPLLCLNHSVVLNVSPIWAGSFRTQGQG